jgi:hypothetical protein
MPDDTLNPNTAEMEAMQRRILDIQQTHRGRIRWHITKHTAELAIAALRRPEGRRRSAKTRRRKRGWKRVL